MRSMDSFRYHLNDAEAKFSRELNLYSADNLLKYNVTHSDVEVSMAQREWAIDLLILAILKHVSVSPNPRSIQTLEPLFNDFKASQPGTMLELDEIIQEGCVRLVWDQWHIPRSFSFTRQVITEEASDLKRFLNLLDSTPYSDTRSLIVTCNEELIESHRIGYTATPDVRWFIDNQVFKHEGEQIVLNVESPYLKTFAARALASLWEDLTVGPMDRDERLSWWMERFEILREGFEFLEWVVPLAREEFLDACVARLLVEQDCLGWDAEIRKIKVEWAAADVDQDQSLLNDQLKLPDETLIGQVIWWEETNLEAAQFVHEARERLSCLFSWVMRWEKKEFPFRTSARFGQLVDGLISRPFFMYELMLESQRSSPSLIPHYLLRPDTLATGTVLLAMFEPNFPGANYSIETKLEREEIARKLWQEAQPFISYTLTQMTDEVAAEAILQITSWLQGKVRKQSVYSTHSEKLERHREQHRVLLETLNGNQIFRGEDHLSRLANALLVVIEKVLRCNKVPIESNPWRLLLWMVERIGQQRIFPENSDLIRKCVSIIVNGYTSSLCLLEKSYWNDELVRDIFSLGWVYIFRWTHDSNIQQWTKLLNPYDFEAELKRIMSEEESEIKKDAHKVLILKIRVHMRLLAGLIVEWSKCFREQPPKELMQLFAQYFLAYQTDNNGISVDAFDFSGVSIHGWQDTKKSALMKSIAEALNCSPDDIRINTLTQFGTKSPDVYRMVSLLNYLQRNSDKKIIGKALIDRGTQGLEEVVWLNNAQEIISELIDSREPQLVDLARAYLERFGNVGIKRRLHGWVEWVFAQQLRIFVITCEYDSILQAAIPEETVEKEYLRSVLDFYKGLVNLEKGGPGISNAIAIFKRITQVEPLNLGNTVNLLACYVRQVEFDSKEGKTDQVEYLTRKAEELAEVILSDPNKEKVTHVEEVLAANILYLTILNENWGGFWSYYERFSPQTKLSSKCGVYAVQVCINQERCDREKASRPVTSGQPSPGV